MPLPSQYLILPDPLLTGASVSTSSTPGDGRIAGPASPSNDNKGDLIPVVTAPSLTTDDAHLFRLLRAGGIYENAEWAWRLDSEGSDDWVGGEDERRLYHGHDPFSDSANHGYGAAVISSSTRQEVYCYRASTSVANRLEVRIRGWDDGPFAWTTDTITLERIATPLTSALCAGVERRDGLILLAVAHGSASLKFDIDLYASTDGVTATRIGRDLIATWGSTGRLDELCALHFARSGDFLRLAYIEGADGKAYTLTSTDGGASWTEHEVLTSGAVAENWYASSNDRYIFGMEGLDDSSGSFVIRLAEAGGPTTLRWYNASRTEGWTRNQASGWESVVSDLQRVILCRAADALWICCWCDDTNPGPDLRWWVEKLSLRDPTDVDNLRQVATNAPDYGNACLLVPYNLRAAAVGSGPFWFGGIGEHLTTNASNAYSVAWYQAGWGRRTLHRTDPIAYAGLRLWDVFWSAALGEPDASAGSPFVWVTSSVSNQWTSDRERIYTNAAGGAGYGYFEVDQGATPTDSWADLSLVGWTCGGFAATDTSDDYVGVRVVALENDGDQVDYSVRYATDGFSVYDNIAGTFLAHVDGLALGPGGAYYEFRAAHYQSKVQVAYSKIADSGIPTWEATNKLTLTPGVSGLTTSQILRWGSLGRQPSQDSYWKDVGYVGDDDWGQYDFSNPTNLRGPLATPTPIYCGKGLSAAWGGGGGAEGDTFTSTPEYAYGLNAMHCASPRLYWQGPTATSISVVYDAEATGAGARWVHDSAAAHNCTASRVLLRYGDTYPWPVSPTQVETISMVAYSNLVLDQVSGNVARVPAPAWKLADGEPSGMAMQIQDTGDPSYGATVPVVIAKTVGSSVYLRAEAGTNLTGLGFAAGTTVCLRTANSATRYATPAVYRYCEVVVDRAGGFAGDGYPRLGALHIGHAVSFDQVPIRWTVEDRREDAVALTRMVGGISSSRWLGPPRRTITGNIEGDGRRWRAGFRALRDTIEGCNRPVSLVLDASYPALQTLPVRLDPVDSHAQRGWRREDGLGTPNYPVGDLAMTFTEET